MADRAEVASPSPWRHVDDVRPAWRDVGHALVADASRQRWDHVQPWDRDTRLTPCVITWFTLSQATLHAQVARCGHGAGSVMDPAAVVAWLRWVMVTGTPLLRFMVCLRPSRARLQQAAADGLSIVAVGCAVMAQARQLLSACDASGVSSEMAAVEGEWTHALAHLLLRVAVMAGPVHDVVALGRAVVDGAVTCVDGDRGTGRVHELAHRLSEGGARVLHRWAQDDAISVDRCPAVAMARGMAERYRDGGGGSTPACSSEYDPIRCRQVWEQCTGGAIAGAARQMLRHLPSAAAAPVADVPGDARPGVWQRAVFSPCCQRCSGVDGQEVVPAHPGPSHFPMLLSELVEALQARHEVGEWAHPPLSPTDSEAATALTAILHALAPRLEAAAKSG